MRERDGLPAVLAAGHLRNNLRRNVTGGGEAVRALDHGARDDGTVLQHIFQIHQVAVVHMLREVVRIVEVDDAFVVRAHHIGRKQQAHRDVLGHFARHIVALHGVHRGVLVGVLLLRLLVVALNEREDLVVGRVGMALQGLHVAVDDVLARHGVSALRHDLVFHHVLDFLDRHGVARATTQPLDAMGGERNLLVGQALVLRNLVVGSLDGIHNLVDVEGHFRAAALDNLHGTSSSLLI